MKVNQTCDIVLSSQLFFLTATRELIHRSKNLDAPFFLIIMHIAPTFLFYAIKSRFERNNNNNIINVQNQFSLGSITSNKVVMFHHLRAT